MTSKKPKSDVAGCQWHAGDIPVEIDDTPSCPNCQRLLATKLCSACGEEFLDWGHLDYDDVLAGPVASSSGDLSCTGCIGQVERELERAEDEADEGDWYSDAGEMP
jgi:hypothetical protein